eukprot:GILJ01015158.1.p1 GENE.GILJ01015158.1~~GILJ01015158.1.p1  ORF type:complete len:489 (+),score=64.33 GILJ01015158.1:196-1662(+)
MSIMHWNMLEADVQFGDFLGSGAFGEVFATTIKGVGPAAVKKISRAKLAEYCSSKLDNSMEPEDLVKAEFECGALLGEDAGFVGAAGLFQDGQFFYLVMPLVTPSKQWEDVKDPFEAMLILVSLLNALARCHAQGVMQRDIRMDNIMFVHLHDPVRMARKGINGLDVPVLADFSLATRAQESAYVFWNFGRADMPPELLNDATYGHGVDLFAVGKIGQQLAARFTDCSFMQKLYAPFCDVLLSDKPEERFSWRAFLLSKVADADDLYRSSFPDAAGLKKKSSSVKDDVSKLVLLLEALLMENDEGASIHREIRRFLCQNNVSRSFLQLRTFIEMRVTERRSSLEFSESDSVGSSVFSAAAFIDDGTELFDNFELHAELGVFHAPSMAQQEPVTIYQRPPRPPATVKGEPTEVNLGPVTGDTATQRDPWAINPNDSPVKAVMNMLDQIAAVRMSRFLEEHYKHSCAALAVAVIQSEDGGAQNEGNNDNM